MNFKLLKLSAVIIALLFAIVSVQGQTIHYVSAGDSTLWEAVQLANSGDILELVDGGGVYLYNRNSDKMYVYTAIICTQK